MQHTLCPICKKRHSIGSTHVWDDEPKPTVEKQQDKPEVTKAIPKKQPFDRVAYQREYMRRKRAKPRTS